MMGIEDIVEATLVLIFGGIVALAIILWISDGKQ